MLNLAKPTLETPKWWHGPGSVNLPILPHYPVGSPSATLMVEKDLEAQRGKGYGRTHSMRDRKESPHTLSFLKAVAQLFCNSPLPEPSPHPFGNSWVTILPSVWERVGGAELDCPCVLPTADGEWEWSALYPTVLAHWESCGGT